MNFDFLDLAAGTCLNVHATEYLKRKLLKSVKKCGVYGLLSTFDPLCIACKLIKTDDEWDHCLREAVNLIYNFY